MYERGKNSIRCVECPTQHVSSLETPVDVGVAGASGWREHERRKQNDDDRLRKRWGRLGGLAVALADERHSTRAWKLGAIGEEKLAASLDGLDDVRVLHDRGVKGTKRNIDHLLISRAGVFVVDAKNYRGTIQVRDNGGLFRTDKRLYVGSRDCSPLADGLTWQVGAVVSALVVAGVDPLPSVTPVLCFVDGEWPLLFRPSEYKSVRLEGTRSLRTLISATGMLDLTAIDELTRALATALPPR